ncbi:MAG TPA: hypothetical protein VMU19_08955 [Bryobacteraceae bacterium]|nr:hypothetical protein [Bryobacteraceae bacterium]
MAGETIESGGRAFQQRIVERPIENEILGKFEARFLESAAYGVCCASQANRDEDVGREPPREESSAAHARRFG